MGTFVMARLTFQEAARRRILLAALLLGTLFLILYGLGINAISQEMNAEGNIRPIERSEVFNFLLMAGLYVVNFLTVMMSVLTSVDTLSGEIASGTMHTIAAKPLPRWQIVLGKWLGYAAMLSLYLLMMAGGVMGLIYLIEGYTAPNALRGLALMELNVLLLLSLTLLGGAILSTLANGVLVFGLYGVAFVGGWIEHVGSFLQNETAVTLGIAASLLMPSEALWKRAAFEMRSPLSDIVGISPFSAPSVPSPLMIGYAALYTALVLFLAIRLFSQRDL